MEAVAQKLEQPLMVNDYHRKEVVFGDEKAQSQFTINTNLITAADELHAGPTPTPTPKPNPEKVITIVPNVPRGGIEEGEIIATRRRNKGWEVLKSFVYGGLAELLASLSLVTSSASADANTCMYSSSNMYACIHSNSYVTYFTTVLYYVTSGVLASVLTYVAGALVKRLVEQLGWFDTHPTINAMSFPIGKNQGMSYY
ncbi:hypothetical protein S83_047973 [Arachis hypogaea]